LYSKGNKKQIMMDYTKDLFTQKLYEFFQRHDPVKQTIVPEIVEKYHENQEIVFKHLTELYAKKHGVEDALISNDSIFSLPPSSHSGFTG
jgi:hypothetical protein